MEIDSGTEWLKGNVSVTDKNQRYILAICQDLIHCTTHGRVKMPKHFTLPVTVKSLTGSAELVTILNHFGHGQSYSQVEEAETAIAEKQAEQQGGGVLLPSS